jgi:hypothetical protein
MKVGDDKAMMIVRGCAGIALATAPVFAWVGGQVFFRGHPGAGAGGFRRRRREHRRGCTAAGRERDLHAVAAAVPYGIEVSGASAPGTA